MMKKMYSVLTSVIVMMGCNNDDPNERLNNPVQEQNDDPKECLNNPIQEEFVLGKWNLTKIINTSFGTSMAPNSNDTHFYRLNRDGTFKRVAIRDNDSSELIGFYNSSDESKFYGNENNFIKHFLELCYSSEANFFNCGVIDSDKQLLILTSDSLLQNTLDGECDGLRYEYTKEIK